MKRTKPDLRIASLLIVVAASFGSGCSRTDNTSGDRQQSVAAKGAKVMPFDLDATTHRFLPNPTGGVQQVVANDPSDTVQVDLIRAHLQEELAKFQQGDFADPTSIHGSDMPGVVELSQAGRDGTLDVSYTPLSDGAELTFASEQPGVVAAVQRWFRAQKSDHGSHAAS